MGLLGTESANYEKINPVEHGLISQKDTLEGSEEIANRLSKLERAMLVLNSLSSERGAPLVMMEKGLPASLYSEKEASSEELDLLGSRAIENLSQKGLIEEAELPQPSTNKWYKLTEKGALVKTALLKEEPGQAETVN